MFPGEVQKAIRQGDRFPSRDPELDHQSLVEVFSLQDPIQRIQRLEQFIESSRQVDGWPSSMLTGALQYAPSGELPEDYFG